MSYFEFCYTHISVDASWMLYVETQAPFPLWGITPPEKKKATNITMDLNIF